jgi:hypothetical protein
MAGQAYSNTQELWDEFNVLPGTISDVENTNYCTQNLDNATLFISSPTYTNQGLNPDLSRDKPALYLLRIFHGHIHCGSQKKKNLQIYLPDSL